MKGRLYYYMKDYTNAKSCLEEAVKNGDQEGVYWQAELYWDSGNQDYAVSLYQNYLSGESPSHQDAYERVASYQISQENYDDALATLEISGLITGDLKFDENGDAIKNYAVIKTIENGEIVYFSTFNGLE